MNKLLINMLLSALLSAARDSGRDAVVRMLTIPEADMKRHAAKSPNPAESMRLQREWAETGADFIASLLPDETP